MKIIKFQERFKTLILAKTKKTTIRRDKNKQYKVGTELSFMCVRNGRNIGLFAKTYIVKITPIQIEVFPRSISFFENNQWCKITDFAKKQFYLDEGFHNEEDFFSFFDERFTGVFITWSSKIEPIPFKGPLLFP